MIDKENFVRVMAEYNNWNSRVHQVADVLGLDLLGSDWIEYTHYLFQDFIESQFNETGVDWINWWLFEKPNFSEEEAKAWDSEHNEIPTNTIDDLWNIIEKERI